VGEPLELFLLSFGVSGIGGGRLDMKKNFGISTARTPDGSWRWELHVPKGSQQDYMKGFARTEDEAEAAAKMAQQRYQQDISN
jgi:hypothetical protein